MDEERALLTIRILLGRERRGHDERELWVAKTWVGDELDENVGETAAEAIAKATEWIRFMTDRRLPRA